jgi:DNA-directed RNA polymerase specialized sigma24 family protein
VVDHHDVVGELVGLLHVLGRQQHRYPVANQVPDNPPQVPAAAGVQARRRLVQVEDAGPPDHAGGQVEAAAHAARVGLDRPAGGVGERELLQQLGGRLSPKLREALLVIEVLGLSYREAGQVLGVPVGTVKSRVFQARERLTAWRAEGGRASEL